MELLIPGLILVGLMAYASTRIKRTAAQAFETERVETEDFTIEKAEGMLHVINGDPNYAFESYSKDLETVGRRDVRMATATVEILDTSSFETPPDETPVTDLNEVIAEQHYRIIETTRVADGIEYHVTRKSAERDGRTFVLEVAIFEKASDEFRRKLDAMVDSFTVKNSAEAADNSV